MRKGIAVSAASAAALVLSSGFAPSAAAATRTPAAGPAGVTIAIATTNGSGCAIGTTSAALAEDAGAFVIDYTDFTAQAGGSSKPTDARKNCQINLKIHVPENFTYAISGMDHGIHGNLQTGAKATYKSSYYFQGGQQTGGTPVELSGPSSNFKFTDVVPESQLVWKPCGVERNFNVNTELRVDKGTSDESKVSSVSMNTGDGGKTVYRLAWKNC
ncbi:DUF4360 domain-containing protein [Actinomadura chibensis]|uniref:DUF4360 domain-containing protein n=1 Tax=Actinomadura chibensis TaxID=392828 RepID=A0A5D0NFD7_9ACTN|nr:DUF4360 domain-containing protein [Actinomadura chibensis]TYB43053.1 DUF4360 domain-containing protein [Actinomadura chibensis]